MLPTVSNTIGAMAAVFVLVIGFTGAAQTVEPLDAYKAYLNAAAKATSPEALFPFISADYKTVLQQAPKTEVAKMLSMGIAKQGLADLKVVTQQVEGDKAVLEMTGKTADGRASSGKATLVKEAGVWKLDEDAWATPTKP
jgi:hypothetical protein